MPKTIAIRREDKSVWEKRVAIIPHDLKKLLNDDVKFLVQPSKIRIYSDDEYRSAGAELSEDIKGADLIIGVKEIPMEMFRKNGAYMFFSHTIKGQPYNMTMLKKLIELEATLFDFECIADDKNRRLVFFGKYAGLAGMIDSFYVLGQRYLAEGIKTVFADVKMAYEYGTLEKAKEALTLLAENVKKNGLNPEIKPAVFGFSGYGNVSQGAQEIFDVFPHIEITPQQLLELGKIDIPDNVLVKVVFKEEDTVEEIEPSGKDFDKFHYFANAEKYRSKFYNYFEHMTCLVNCIFWTNKSPMLMTIEDCEKLYKNKNNRLKVIGDISCDIKGGIECTFKATQPDEPAFVYDIDKKDIVMGVIGNGPAIMAVDNLPCEISKSSSDAFSEALMPFMPKLAKIDTTVDFDSADLPDPIKRSAILWKGKFTPAFTFMKSFVK